MCGILDSYHNLLLRTRVGKLDVEGLFGRVRSDGILKAESCQLLDIVAPMRLHLNLQIHGMHVCRG